MNVILMALAIGLGSQDNERDAVLQYRILYSSREEAQDERKSPQAVVGILRRRLDSIGLREADVRVFGDDGIESRIPGCANPEELTEYKNFLGRWGRLELCTVAPKEIHERWMENASPQEGWKTVRNDQKLENDYAYLGGDHILVSSAPVITGPDLRSAVAEHSLEEGWVIRFQFHEEAAKRFDTEAKKLFHQNPRGLIAILFDGNILSKPRITSERFGGSGTITGGLDGFPKEEAVQLAAMIHSGELPVPIGRWKDTRPETSIPEVEKFVPRIPYRIPETRRQEDGWEVYVEPITITAESAKNLWPGSVSVEATLVHFYASRIRGDNRWEEMLPFNPDEDAPNLMKILEMKSRTFLTVRLLARKRISDEEYAFRLYSKIEVQQKMEEKEGQGKVRRVRGRWLVTLQP